MQEDLYPMKLRILISSKVLKSNINIRSVCQFTAL